MPKKIGPRAPRPPEPTGSQLLGAHFETYSIALEAPSVPSPNSSWLSRDTQTPLWGAVQLPMEMRLGRTLLGKFVGHHVGNKMSAWGEGYFYLQLEFFIHASCPQTLVSNAAQHAFCTMFKRNCGKRLWGLDPMDMCIKMGHYHLASIHAVLEI